jgi:hypothetical protein
MYDLHLSPEQLEIRDMVRDFAANEIKPIAEQSSRMEARDRSPIASALAQAAELGLRTLALPEDMGGAGADALTSVIVAEELGFGDPDTASILAETSLVAHAMFADLASPAQRDLWLPKLASEPEAQLAWARGLGQTEIGVNYHRQADTAHATITATRTGNHFVLDGTSRGVANAPVASLVVVSAALDGRSNGRAGLAAFLVPRGAEGMKVTSLPQGRFLGPSGDVSFESCKVPADHLLGGADGSAAARALAYMDRVPVRQAINLAIGRSALEAALEYAKLRVQGGRPIAEHQAIAEKLAGAAVAIETARQSIWAAAWAADHPEAVPDRSLPGLPLATIAHIHTAERIYRAVKDCVECFGAMSVMRDMPLHKFVEDARRCLHAAGGIADHKFALAEALAGFRRE